MRKDITKNGLTMYQAWVGRTQNSVILNYLDKDTKQKRYLIWSHSLFAFSPSFCVIRKQHQVLRGTVSFLSDNLLFHMRVKKKEWSKKSKKKANYCKCNIPSSETYRLIRQFGPVKSKDYQKILQCHIHVVNPPKKWTHWHWKAESLK